MGVPRGDGDLIRVEIKNLEVVLAEKMKMGIDTHKQTSVDMKRKKRLESLPEPAETVPKSICQIFQTIITDGFCLWQFAYKTNKCRESCAE